MSCEENTRKDENMYVENKFFENVTDSKYLGMTLTDHNCMPEEIKGKLNLGNAYCREFRILYILLCYLKK
jgi:hypothetical protein